MTAEQRILRRLRRLVADAKAAGLVLIADADAMAIRVMTREEERSEDLRTVGRTVYLDGGCGSDKSRDDPSGSR